MNCPEGSEVPNIPTKMRGVGEPLDPEVESNVTQAIPTGSEV